MNSIQGIAQSNIQLYDQLQDGGYSNDEISRVADAYHLAQKLFAACFRGSGRPFLCHLVGTASVLARDGAPLHVVIAGLLHAAYSAGLFSFDMHQQMSSRKRAMVSTVVGGQAEKLIADYAALNWDHATLAHLAGDKQSAQQQVVRLRLANELDDLADNGLRYSGEAKGALIHDPEAQRLLMILVSRAGMPALEAGMKRALSDFAEVTDTLSVAPGTVGRDYSYTLLPSCAGLRLNYRLAVFRRRVVRRLGRDDD